MLVCLTVFDALLTYVKDQALASYQRVMDTTSPASVSNISKYRKWMEDKAPIVEEEAKFLDSDDLLTLGPHASKHLVASISSHSDMHAAIYGGASAVLYPLLVFALVPRILTRFVLLLLGYGALSVLCPHEHLIELWELPDVRISLSVYLPLVCIGAVLM